MKYVLFVLSLFFICVMLVASSFAKGIYMKKQGGGIVFTNISMNRFFVRAFRYANSKTEVIKLIKSISRKYGVNPDIVMAIAKIESDYKKYAISSKGAKGVMQLMSNTSKFYGVKNPYNVEENIEGGVRFIKHLLIKYHNNLRLVAAAYNAGETVVDKYGGIPPYPETKRYVSKFMRFLNKDNVEVLSKSTFAHTSKRSMKLIKIGNVYTNIRCSLW